MRDQADATAETGGNDTLATRSASVIRSEHLSRSVAVAVGQDMLDEECQLRPLPRSLNTPGLLGEGGIRWALGVRLRIVAHDVHALRRLHLHDSFRYDPLGRFADIAFVVSPAKTAEGATWLQQRSTHR
jgi:hypothetical protein